MHVNQSRGRKCLVIFVDRLPQQVLNLSHVMILLIYFTCKYWYYV